ncbi:MAG: hypothetical protein IPL75_13955 [Acidobacteria bacterium]|nr:hypothetical protein [Acidobacteriota bacterium]
MSVAGLGLVAVLFAAALADPALAWFAVLTAVGGGLAAGTLITSRRNGLGAGTLTQPDPMSQGRILGDVINFASVRVAGIGGLPLVAFAVVLALNFPKIGWTVTVGLAGGVVLAVATIVVRRWRGRSTPATVRRADAGSCLRRMTPRHREPGQTTLSGYTVR